MIGLARFLHIALLLAFGGALGWLGVLLLGAGGSSYYLIAAVALLVTAVLVARRDRRAPVVYGVFLAGTIAWSLAEAGLDGWALAPRLGLPLLLGIPLLGPRAGRVLGWTGVIVVPVLVVVLFLAGRETAPAVPSPVRPIAEGVAGDWLHYGNDAGGSHYSPLGQIDAANVSQLRRAWIFHTGIHPGPTPVTFEVTPIEVAGRLFLCTALNEVIALDAESGRLLWRHNPADNVTGIPVATCRGVAYYRVPGSVGPCAERIYTATVDARLLALDASTGRPCPTFGKAGAVDLRTDMGGFDPGYYFVTSAPQVVRGKVLVGGWITDGQMVGEPSGVVRAFDAVSGKLGWAFDIGHPDRRGAPPPGQPYTRGTPNSWAPMSADERMGLVFVPTGNATPDYFGGHRTALDDRFSSSVVALDAETGAVRWSFQTTHHDLWDYDVPAQPTLVDLPGPKGVIPAVIQPTKRGEIFLLDRRTGHPIAPVVERPVPRSHVPGERASPTQPFSPGMPSFSGPALHEIDMWGLTPIDQAWCRLAFRRMRYNGPLTPPGIDRPSMVYPGYGGGINWGGVSVDRGRGIMIVNSNRFAIGVHLIPRAEALREGIAPRSSSNHGDASRGAAQQGVPYAAIMRPFMSPLGVPCQRPPWGMIAGVDLKTRALLWSKPFGTGRDSGPFGLPSMLPIPIGVPNMGGSVTTASGLTFVAATHDRYLRVLDTLTGRELRRLRLPAGGQATPMSFRSASGRQFVVIAAGGNPGLGTKAGDAVIAYALPLAK